MFNAVSDDAYGTRNRPRNAQARPARTYVGARSIRAGNDERGAVLREKQAAGEVIPVMDDDIRLAVSAIINAENARRNYTFVAWDILLLFLTVIFGIGFDRLVTYFMRRFGIEAHTDREAVVIAAYLVVALVGIFIVKFKVHAVRQDYVV